MRPLPESSGPEPKGDDLTDRGALIDAAWEELRVLAREELRSAGPRPGIESPTSILGEAMVHLLGQREEIRNLAQLRGLTTLFLRRIIIDRQRRDGVRRRHVRRIAREIPPAASVPPAAVPLQLAEALASLGEYHERKLAALTLSAAHDLGDADIAEALGISLATVERDLRFARAWVAARLELPR